MPQLMEPVQSRRSLTFGVNAACSHCTVEQPNRCAVGGGLVAYVYMGTLCVCVAEFHEQAASSIYPQLAKSVTNYESRHNIMATSNE